MGGIAPTFLKLSFFLFFGALGSFSSLRTSCLSATDLGFSVQSVVVLLFLIPLAFP